jgi:hypothetical protein
MDTPYLRVLEYEPAPDDRVNAYALTCDNVAWERRVRPVRLTNGTIAPYSLKARFWDINR